MGRPPKKPSPEDLAEDEKQSVCVRMDRELFDKIVADADKAERSPPAQIRLLLRQHYGLD